MSDPIPKLLSVFLNAWWIAVNISHNKNMEYLNNPTPEVTFEMIESRERLKRLRDWAGRRWGLNRVGNLIKEKEGK